MYLQLKEEEAAAVKAIPPELQDANGEAKGEADYID